MDAEAEGGILRMLSQLSRIFGLELLLCHVIQCDSICRLHASLQSHLLMLHIVLQALDTEVKLQQMASLAALSPSSTGCYAVDSIARARHFSGWWSCLLYTIINW